ncbi:hypothetical protein [Desulfovirgula thermocuniculi]|uniref:hypothetical protein n=1 Tax=Desulfovirgula thermocuniculi TaxID=348842 RepID=UPI0012ECA548|nr:hypothetical protein [Desulfovirgula thermocuniculi]
MRGILPDAPVTVVSVQRFGSHAVELTYKDPAGRLGNVLLWSRVGRGASMAHFDLVNCHHCLVSCLLWREEFICCSLVRL